MTNPRTTVEQTKECMQWSPWQLVHNTHSDNATAEEQTSDKSDSINPKLKSLSSCSYQSCSLLALRSHNHSHLQSIPPPIQTVICNQGSTESSQMLINHWLVIQPVCVFVRYLHTLCFSLSRCFMTAAALPFFSSAPAPPAPPAPPALDWLNSAPSVNLDA